MGQPKRARSLTKDPAPIITLRPSANSILAAFMASGT
jgi:hypothetical protein